MTSTNTLNRQDRILASLGPQYSGLMEYGSGSTRDTYTVRWSPTGEFEEGKYETRFVRVDKENITNEKAKRNSKKGYGTNREIGILLSLNRLNERPESHNLEALLDARESEEDGTISVSTFIPNSTDLMTKVKRDGPIRRREEFYQAFSGVTNAINYLNSHGLYHRDITPKNILVTDTGKAVVVDLALAKPKDEEGNEKNTATTLGRSMTDPRVTELNKKYDDFAEVYSIGANMYYALTGKEINPKDIKGSLKELKRNERKLVEKCLTSNLEDRFRSVEEVHDEIEKRRESLRGSKKRGILMAAAITSLLGIAGYTHELSTSKKQLEEKLVEPKKYEVEVGWDGKGISAGNSLVDMNIRYAYRDVNFKNNEKIKMYPGDIPFVEVRNGDSINLYVSLNQTAGAHARSKVGDPAIPTLSGRVYIEGGKEVKQFYVSPSSYNGAEVVEMHSTEYGGTSLSIKVPSQEEIGVGVRNVAIEIMSPEDTQNSSSVNVKAINWNGDGRIISRKVLPFYIEREGEEIEKNKQPKLHSLVLDDYTGDRIVFTELNDRTPWGTIVNSGFSYHTYLPEIERKMPPLDLLNNEKTWTYDNVSMPEVRQETTATVVYSVWDDNGNLRNFGGVPVSRKFRYENSPGNNFYGWDVGNDGKNLPQVLRAEFEKLKDIKLNPKVAKKEETK